MRSNSDSRSVQESNGKHPSDLRYFGIYLVGFFAAWTCWVLLGYPRLKQLGDQTLEFAIIGMSCRMIIWVLPVFLYLWFVDGVDAVEFLKLRQKIGLGVGVGIAVTILNFLLTRLQMPIPIWDPQRITWNSIPSTSIGIGLFEEIPFRGFIQQKLTARRGFTQAAMISSALFSAIHFPGWIMLGMFSPGLAVRIFLFGAVMACLLRWTGSLWTCIVAHSLNDCISHIIFHH